jgi:hypothetical protein
MDGTYKVFTPVETGVQEFLTIQTAGFRLSPE